jgi:hypothetical protein
MTMVEARAMRGTGCEDELGVIPDPPGAHLVGQLCHSGDWACTQRDLTLLAAIAERIASHVPESVRLDLWDVIEACENRPERAIELWSRIKDRLYEVSASS